MPDPFDLADEAAYRAWRSRKLARYPAKTDELLIRLKQLAHPSAEECAALRERIDTYNMALVRVAAEQIEPSAVLDFGRALGLMHADTPLFADRDALSRITRADASLDEREPPDARGDYIPYTDRPLSWHTDGYYNAPDRPVSAWTLFCVRPAASGGANALFDHEIAYIRLRDTSPRHIEALSHPQALTIPANVRGDAVIRPESQGPVFSVRQGRLHMRYSARTKNVRWRKTPETDAAREALDRLFSNEDVFTFFHRLEPGEGIVSNNVLHNRSGFVDEEDTSRRRLLIRVRYHERVATDLPQP